MKMDRYRNSDGLGKYALVLMREMRLYEASRPFEKNTVTEAFDTLRSEGVLDEGIVGTESEFFVIRLKDKYAAEALSAYADAAQIDDPEWAAEVREMIPRAGRNSPWQKQPD